MRVERALVGILCVAAVTATGCGGGKLAYNLPPASRLMEPGPGVGGPGPGVIPPAGAPYGMYGGAVNRFGGNAMGGPMGPCAANGQMPMAPGMHAGMGPNGQLGNDVMQTSFNENGQCGCEGGACALKPGLPPGAINDPRVMQAGFHGHGLLGHGGPGCYTRPGSVESYGDGGDGAGAFGVGTSQIAFLGDEGVHISWDVGGYGMFDSEPLVVPGRQDFYQGSIYRLRLSNIPGRPGIELFPTLEVAPVTPRTDAYLAHSPIPVQFTEEDFDQVTSGNFVTKVIYLPDPEFQELALAGVETLVSTRLDPGVDPIVEADRRGSILAILRMGNKDLRRAGTNVEYESEVVPASHTERDATDSEDSQVRPASAEGDDATEYESQALYNEELDASGSPIEGGVTPAQYCGPYGDGSMNGMPMGMPTAGFAPPAVPPNMLAGGPQYGMPITGTPIGLPGPPHIPLGVPAGLQRHTMKNKTRVMIPPPVTHMHMTVKQRPGLNYPRPVNHVHVNETQREPLRLLPGWMSGMFGGGGGSGNAYAGGGYGPDCQ